MKYLLGVDVGTTGTKSLLFSEDGGLLGHAYRGYETKTPGVSRSEQNAEDWWQAVVQTVREACGGEEIAGMWQPFLCPCRVAPWLPWMKTDSRSGLLWFGATNAVSNSRRPS